MKYDLELFNKGNHYIKLETQEKYDEVMEYLDKNGYIWCNGDSLKPERYWKFYKERTSVRIGSRKRINYSSFDYYKRAGYTELISSEPKQDLRELLQVGYRVKYKNGLYHNIFNETIKDISRDFNEVEIIERPCECGFDYILVWKREE